MKYQMKIFDELPEVTADIFVEEEEEEEEHLPGNIYLSFSVLPFLYIS